MRMYTLCLFSVDAWSVLVMWGPVWLVSLLVSLQDSVLVLKHRAFFIAKVVLYIMEATLSMSLEDTRLPPDKLEAGSLVIALLC